MITVPAFHRLLPAHRPRRAPWAVLALALLTSAAALAQSTFASILGTVRDSSGGTVASSKISVENTGTSAKRATVTDSGGNYSVPNLEPGSYNIVMEAPAFQTSTYKVELTARQVLRIDGQLAVASQAQTVSVVAEAAPVINTEVSNIAETKSRRELVDLPVAIATRSTGSTSPMSTPTGFQNLIGSGNGRADIVSGVSLHPSTQTWKNWVNATAFAVPANNIGRFGNAPVGNLIGPGTEAVSLSLMKAVAIRESLQIRIGAQVGNLFNHPNCAPPNVTLTTAAFGTLSSLQSAEGAGPRQIQLTGRITF